MKIRYFLISMLLLPTMMFCTCTPQNNNEGEGTEEETEKEPAKEPWREPVFDRNSEDPADEVIDVASLQVITPGCSVRVTRDYIENFITGVSYTDHDYTSTSIYDYPGGYNDKSATEIGPVTNADKPAYFVIKWTPDASAGELTLNLKDGDWSRDIKVAAGADSQVITNLRPKASYTYKVTAGNGNVLTQGSFTTTGSIHQCYFPWNVRNCRDLGGWETYDGKHVKYRKIYRGGRMEGSTMSREGREEILAEGIRAQLELRGSSDMLHWGVLGEDLPFCNPCIENGGTSMLGSKEKTKACFEFVLQCVRENKPVYFHCSLGRDRTGTMAALLLGVLGVKEGDISKEYELSYFAPRGWSIAYSEKSKYFRNTRMAEYASLAQYMWIKGYNTETKTYDRFDQCVEKYLLWIGVPQADIDEFRSLMLED